MIVKHINIFKKSSVFLPLCAAHFNFFPSLVIFYNNYRQTRTHQIWTCRGLNLGPLVVQGRFLPPSHTGSHGRLGGGNYTSQDLTLSSQATNFYQASESQLIVMALIPQINRSKMRLDSTLLFWFNREAK